MKCPFVKIIIALLLTYWLLVNDAFAQYGSQTGAYGSVSPNISGNAATATLATNALNGNQYWVRGTNYGGPFPMIARSAAYPGDALQAVLNLMVTNGEKFANPNFQSPPFNATSNILNGHLHIYAFNDANNQQGMYYRAPGFIYSNTWPMGQPIVEGDGMLNTFVVGDSNAFTFVTPSIFGELNYEIKGITFCFSNSAAKSACVNLIGISPGLVDRCMVDWMADLVFTNFLGFAESGWTDMNGTELAGGDNGANVAMAGMIISGTSGHVTVRDSFIGYCAAGLIVAAEHARVEHCEFECGMFNNSPTNGWLTNDLSYLPLEYGGPLTGIRGCDLALGPQVILGLSLPSGANNTADDCEMLGDKTLGGGIGVLVKNGNYFYGLPKLIDCHFEAVGSGQGISGAYVPKDVVLDNDTNYFVHNIQPIFVSEHDCSDQQTSDGAIVNWQFNGTNFLLSTNFPILAGFGTNCAIDQGVYQPSGYPQFCVKSNNIVIFGGSGVVNVGINGIVYTNLTGCITGTNAVHYTVPSGTTNGYSINGLVTVTALSLDVAQPKIIWTDENGTVQSVSLGTSISGTGYNNLPNTFIRAKGGTVIDVTNALTTGTGSLTYDISANLIPIESNQ